MAMGLFVVRHHHDPERCPAGDPDLGAALLNHLSRPTAKRQGIEVKGEAVVQGEHTLYLILEAGEEDGVRRFLEPFALAGSVEVYPASTCARVVASGGCAAVRPAVDGGVAAMDPQEACQRSSEPGLVVHRAHPLTFKTSIPPLLAVVVMPHAHVYVRNHLHIPDLDPEGWRLRVAGLGERALSL